MKTGRLLGALVALTLAAPGASAQSAPDERITLTLDDADLGAVLESFGAEYHLNIVAGPDVRGAVTMHLYEATVDDALRAVLAVNGFGFRREGDFYFIEPLAKLQAEHSAEPLKTAVVWLDYLLAEEALRLVEPFRSQDGKFTAGAKAEYGIPSDPTVAGGNSPAGGEVILLRDRVSIVDEVEALLKQLDRRPRQVLIEATILEVRLDDETKLGVDFNTLGGIDFSDLGAVSNLNSLQMNPATPVQIADGLSAVSTSGFAADGNTDGLHIGIIQNDVAIFVEALESVTDATVLANPRVLAVDRQKAEIIVGAKLGYLTSTTTETSTLQQVEFLDIGTQLRFRPFISSDGFVRLEIHPENSTGVVDPASGLPSETTTEVTSNVIVRDGNTIVIGGLISDQVENVVKQVPVLGSIPWIGWLFRQTTESVTRREVIVLLTPHIIDGGVTDLRDIEQADAMAMNREQAFRGQLPLSRIRLAAPWLDKAEAALAQGRHEDAVRYTDFALFFLPTDVRAARLRQSALAALGIVDEEVRTLDELEGWR